MAGRDGNKLKQAHGVEAYNTKGLKETGGKVMYGQQSVIVDIFMLGIILILGVLMVRNVSWEQWWPH